MSTDSDPPTDELKEAFPRVAELERRLREADIDLGDLPQKEGITRRDLVKAAGTAGVAGLVGAGGMNAATEPASAGSSSAGDWGTADNPGDFYSEDHFAVDQSAGGLTTPPTGFLNFGFESGTAKVKDSGGVTSDLGGGLEPSLVSVVNETGSWSTYDPANYLDVFDAVNQALADTTDGEQISVYLPVTGSGGVSANTTLSISSTEATPNIYGWGYNATVIDYTATDGTPAIDHPDPNNNEDYEWGHFALSGPGSGAGGGGNGIEIGADSTTSTNHSQTVRHLQVNDFPGRGIAVWGLFTGSLTHVQTESNGSDGIFVQRLNGGNIQNCISQMNGGAQLHAEDCINGVIGPGNDFDSAGGGSTPVGSVGVRVSQVSKRGGPNIVDNYFEQNETHVSMENNGVPVRGVIVRGNRFQDGSTGVHVVDNVNRSFVLENWFQGVGSNDIDLGGTGMVLGPNTHINSTTKVANNTGLTSGWVDSLSKTADSYPW